MTARPPVPVPPAGGARATADRLRRLAHLRERAAHEAWLIWTETPDGLRCATATGAARDRLVAAGWRWVARQMRAWAAAVEGEAPAAPAAGREGGGK